MPFENFKIPPKASSKINNSTGYTCNARIRTEGDGEEYCQEITKGTGRCPHHNVYERLEASREEARLKRMTDPTSVGERVAELEKDKRNLTRLDELVYNSLATIQELDRRYPLATVSANDALSIARLREKHAALVHQRVDLEIKLKTLLDADFIYDTSAKLFEKNITDKNTKKILMEGIAVMLDSLVRSGNAVPHDDAK